MGFNEASGDNMIFKYNGESLDKINIMGDARGIFFPEKNQTKLDSTLSYQAHLINYHINDQMTYLEDDVKIQYQDTELSSGIVDVNWKNNMLYAYSTDSSIAKITTQNQKLNEVSIRKLSPKTYLRSNEYKMVYQLIAWLIIFQNF